MYRDEFDILMDAGGDLTKCYKVSRWDKVDASFDSSTVLVGSGELVYCGEDYEFVIFDDKKAAIWYFAHHPGPALCPKCGQNLIWPNVFYWSDKK